MKPLVASLAVLSLLVTACSSKKDETPGSSAETPAALVTRMNTETDALMARAEHQAAEVEVQHVLIGVQGGLPGVTRSPAEAEELAALVYARARKGEDFDTLERNYSGDMHPGIYTMTAQRTNTPGVWPRQDMARAFGDVAWRLEVGEVGVARYDGALPGDSASPFGYHIVRRLK
jgi:hypothetical protein